jgi:hypothetical protein
VRNNVTNVTEEVHKVLEMGPVIEANCIRIRDNFIEKNELAIKSQTMIVDQVRESQTAA